MKYLFSLVAVCIFIACNSSDYSERPTGSDTLKNGAKPDSFAHFVYNFKDTILENRITDTLMKLPFVKKSSEYIDSFSNHAHGIAFMLDTLENQISVSAGYNGPDRFENYYLFKVDPKTLQIQIQDIESGEWVPVEKYMKQKSDR